MSENKENETTVSNRFQSRKRQRKQQHRTRTGLHDSTNDLQFYEVSLPFEEEVKKKIKIEPEDDCFERAQFYPDMAGDNVRMEFNLNKTQLKQLSKLKMEQNKRLIALEEQERLFNADILDDAQFFIQKKSPETAEQERVNMSKTQEEEVLERAELYGMTTVPDSHFYSLDSPDYPDGPLDLSSCGKDHYSKEWKYPSSHGNSGTYNSHNATRKRKRRSYNNINCYVSHHNKKDPYDNTQMLPEGTRLIKPPNKLVELVAQAIDSSPDGLLQVQHIYTILQNKYPYFRYMDKPAINSWRSSIRHALYQKWFRKLRFRTEAINSKGCFWALNRKYNPKEWTMPKVDIDEEESTCTSLQDETCSLDLDFELEEDESLAAVASMLADCDPLLDDDSDYGSEDCTSKDTDLTEEAILDGHLQSGRQFSLPASVRNDPDPILTACSTQDVEEPIGESKIDMSVVAFQEDPPPAHMDNHCMHDWTVPMWEEGCSLHYPQMEYAHPPLYCWDYMPPQQYAMCSDNHDHVDHMEGMGYGYPVQPFMDEHCFS